MPPPTFRYRRNQTELKDVVKFECKVNSDDLQEGCKRCEAHHGDTFQNAYSHMQERQCARYACMATPYCWQHLQIICRLRVMRSRLLDEVGYPGLGLYAWHPPSGKKNIPILSTYKEDDVPRVVHTGLMQKYSREDDKLKRLYGGEILRQETLDKRYDYGGVTSVAPYGDAIRNPRKKDHAKFATDDDGAALEDDNARPKGQVTYVKDAACVRGIASFANDARSRKDFKNNIYLEDGDIVLRDNTRIYHGDELLVSYGDQYWKDIANGDSVTTGMSVSAGQVRNPKTGKMVPVKAFKNKPNYVRDEVVPEGGRAPFAKSRRAYLNQAYTKNMK